MMTLAIVLVIFLGGTIASFLMCYSDRFGVRAMTGTSQSICDNCGKRLKPVSLIPFFGARVGCTSCTSKGSWWYIVLELIFATLFSYIVFGIVGYVGITAIGIAYALVSITILGLFLMLALIDAKHYVFPEILLWVLLGASAVFIVLSFVAMPLGAPLSIKAILKIVGSGIIWGIPLALISTSSKEKLMGAGDGMLMGIMGLVIAPIIMMKLCAGCFWRGILGQSTLAMMVTLFMASVFGIVWALVQNYRKYKKITLIRKQAIPFGPALIGAFALVVIFVIMN